MPALRKRLRVSAGRRNPCLARISRWSRECFGATAGALILNRPLDPDRLSQCSPNHFFRTSCPTAIEARIGYRDCEIVAASIMALFRTRGAARPIVSRPLPRWSKVIENAKLAPVRIEGRQINPRSRPELLRHLHALNKPAHVVLGDFLQA